MLITISDKVRIEDAPPRKQAMATKELLDDRVTAGHYQAPRKATVEEIDNPSIDTSDGMIRPVDALGKKIELGKPMDYIDWKCRPEERVWVVYQLSEVESKGKDGKPIKSERFMPVGTFPTMEEANGFALTL